MRDYHGERPAHSDLPHLDSKPKCGPKWPKRWPSHGVLQRPCIGSSENKRWPAGRVSSHSRSPAPPSTPRPPEPVARALRSLDRGRDPIHELSLAMDRALHLNCPLWKSSRQEFPHGRPLPRGTFTEDLTWGYPHLVSWDLISGCPHGPCLETTVMIHQYPFSSLELVILFGVHFCVFFSVLFRCLPFLCGFFCGYDCIASVGGIS